MKIVDLLEVDPYKGMKDVKGTVYLIHLNRPLAHSQHYIGWTTNLQKRMEEHQSGRGSPYLRAAKEAGINFEVARVWLDKDRHFERKLKNRKNGRKMCPICKAQGQPQMHLESHTVINESAAPLYHVTAYSQAYSILTGNNIHGRTEHHVGDKVLRGVSLTRSLTFAKWWAEHQTANIGVILQLNQEKLKHKYKIVPIDYFSTTVKHDAEMDNDFDVIKHSPHLRRKNLYAEAEEFLIADNVPNFDQYVDAILIPKKSYDKIERMGHGVGPGQDQKQNADKLQKLKYLANNPKAKII